MTDHDQESLAHQERRLASQRLIGDLKNGRVSRRDFMVKAAALGFSGAAINVFLIACGGTAATNTPAAAVATNTTAATTAATRAATTAAPAAATGTRAATTAATTTRVATAAGTATRAATAAGTATRAATATRTTATASPTRASGVGIRAAEGTLLGGPVDPNAPLAGTQELRYPFTELTHADPGQMTSVAEVQFGLACWDSLVSSNQEGDPRPAHATSYTISPDGLTYTFTLRSDIRFSDGSPLTAADYEWTWKRNLDPETASEYAQALFPIAGAEEFNSGDNEDRDSVQVRATNPTTLVVTLAEPAPYFLALVSTWTYFPLKRAAIEQYGEQWVEAGNMVSAGKFKLTQWEHDVRMTIERDENYYGTKPILQRIVFTIYADVAASALPAYERNEIDVVTAISPDALPRVRNDATLSQQLTILPNSSCIFLCCDVTNQRSPVSRKEFRQALYYAINRDRLANDVLRGQYIPTTTLVPPGILGRIEQPPLPNVSLTGNRDRARQLLQAAGYSNQEIVLTHSAVTRSRTTAEAIQQDWRDVGINVRLEALESKAFTAWREARKNQAFDVYLGGWFSDYEDPNNWYNFFFQNPDQEFWHTHYPQLPASADFVQLIRSGNQARNRNEREQIYQRAERRLLEDLPLIPLYNFQDALMVKPWVKGLVHTNIGQDIFTGVRILRGAPNR